MSNGFCHIRFLTIVLFCFNCFTILTCTTPDRFSNPVKDNSNDVSLAQLELPIYDNSREDVLFYTGYTSSYNHTTLIPNWVAYELKADEIVEPALGNKYFIPDPNVKGRQATFEDYRNDECWDKGHMVPKADLKWSQKAYDESFFFTNICPQNCSLNNGAWKSLEHKVRNMAKQYGRIYVVCGPIFDNYTYGTLGEQHVAIPDAFFKALLIPVGNGIESIAFIMPNDGNRLSWQEYACTVDSLEIVLSRNLFPSLDDGVESQVESCYNLKFWGLF